MAVQLNTYLNFRDNARDAMEFYRSIFGGELTVSTFAEFQASEDPSEQDKIMHSMLQTEEGLVLMGADTPNSIEYVQPGGFALSVSGDDEPRLRGYWGALTADGTVTMPLEPAPWGDVFGMCTDKFGVSWMIDIGATEQ